MKAVAKESQPKVDKKGVCFVGLYQWIVPKYQNKGLHQYLTQVSNEFLLRNTSFIYMWGVAVNPTSIYTDIKVNPYIIKMHSVELTTFELPDGTRPFKDFDFKDPNGTRVMGIQSQIKGGQIAKL